MPPLLLKNIFALPIL